MEAETGGQTVRGGRLGYLSPTTEPHTYYIPCTQMLAPDASTVQCLLPSGLHSLSLPDEALSSIFKIATLPSFPPCTHVPALFFSIVLITD